MAENPWDIWSASARFGIARRSVVARHLFDVRGRRRSAACCAVLCVRDYRGKKITDDAPLITATWRIRENPRDPKIPRRESDVAGKMCRRCLRLPTWEYGKITSNFSARFQEKHRLRPPSRVSSADVEIRAFLSYLNLNPREKKIYISQQRKHLFYQKKSPQQ